MMDSETKSFRDIVEIVKRRCWLLVVPAVTVFCIAVIVAFALPKKYRSTATILIEAQEVPSEYVKANITSFADQRLQAINQRIMGAPKLLEIIKRFNLYSESKSRMTMEEIIDQMRKKDIKFNTISADVVDPRSGRPAQATIAFSVSYVGPTPDIAQQVTNELSSLYMEENLKVREQQSETTSNFLNDELKIVQAALTAIEGRIASFKQRNINTLPELSQVNMQAYDDADREIRLLNDQYRTLKEKESYLHNELSSVSPELDTNEKESLRQLKLKLTDLKSRFSDQYPDVIKTKSEIKELEHQMKKTTGKDGGRPENPAYITLSSQLAATRSDMGSLKRQIAELAKRRSSYQSRIFSSPRVEEGYKAMMVERNNLQQKYDDLSRKAMEAKVAHGMEKEQLGERFTLVDPARLPEKSTSPNVPGIMMVGLVLGIGAGIGAAALRESLDQSVHHAEYLEKLTGLPVLVTIPDLSCKPARSSGNTMAMVVTAGLVILVGAAVLCHYFVMDLDILFAKTARTMARYR